MNPPDEIPESSVNGQTRTIEPSASASRAKPRPKKAPELPTLERRNWLIHAHYVRQEFETCKVIIRLSYASFRFLDDSEHFYF